MTPTTPTLLATAVATFVATDIDDLALLVGWFSDRSYRASHIAIGQFLGIATLTAASAVLGLLAILVPASILGFLGILPIGIGISRLVGRSDDKKVQAVSAAKSILAVAGVTIAHGSDNLAVYVPLFVTQTPFGISIIVAVFLLMTGVWLVVAHWFVRHPAWGPLVQRCGDRIVPWALILVGASIIYEAGTLAWIAKVLH